MSLDFSFHDFGDQFCLYGEDGEHCDHYWQDGESCCYCEGLEECGDDE